jgi:hypothetical protein
MSIRVPANTMTLFGMINALSSFDLIPVDESLNVALDFDEYDI